MSGRKNSMRSPSSSTRSADTRWFQTASAQGGVESRLETGAIHCGSCWAAAINASWTFAPGGTINVTNSALTSEANTNSTVNQLGSFDAI
jgi:hypothetical protein